jgi:hypothetical protein
MKTHLNVISAVLRKDILSLWPLLLLTILLRLLWSLDTDFSLPFISPLVRPFLSPVAQFSAAILVLAVIHLDASASTRHDWLTRPIPRRDLLTAKALFILLAVVAPISVASFTANLFSGHSFVESLSIATTIERTMIVLMALTLIAIAFLTATLVEAIGVIALLIMVIASVPAIAFRISGVGEEITVLGMGWTLSYAAGLLIVVSIVTAAWLQYARRNATLARTVFGLSIFVAAASPAFITWDGVFALQKAYASNQSAADDLKISLNADCFPAAILNPVPIGLEELADNQPFGAAWRRAAGENAITFKTGLIPSGAPADWKIMIARVSATYRTDKDEVVHSLRPARFTPQWSTDTGVRIANHQWLLSRADYQRLATQPVHLQLDYSLSLLAPHAIEIPIDRPRELIPQLGYCGAIRDPSSKAVKVDCFKHGQQPALVTSELAGIPSSQKADDFPDYTPSWLEFFGGRGYRATLKQPTGANATHVKVTIYEAQAFADRRLIAPGILGGAPNTCPAPAAK